MTSIQRKLKNRNQLIRLSVLLMISVTLLTSAGCQAGHDSGSVDAGANLQVGQTSMDPSRDDGYNDEMDLSIMYEDVEAWKGEFKILKDNTVELMDAATKLEGLVKADGDRLKSLVKLRDSLDRMHDKLTVYAMLLRDSDSSNQDARDIYQLVISERSHVSSATGSFDDAMYNLDKGLLKRASEKWEAGEEKEFVRGIIDTDYEPNEEANAIRSAAGSIADTPEDIFYAYLYPQTAEDSVADAGGQKGDYFSKDPKERKKAYDAEKARISSGRDVLGATLASEVAMNYFEARSYGYGTAKEAALDQDSLSEASYRIILERPREKRAEYQRYLNHLKGLMGVDRIRYYDRTVEPSHSMPDYPLSSVRELLSKALGPLGATYLKVVDEAFENKWLDLGSREGKYDGAYTLGAYDSNPFIIMTYEDDIGSVATLGHELGHLVNDVLTNRSQPFRRAVITSLKAEMASTTNEVLIYDYLLKTTSDVELRKGILKNYIDFINDAYFYQSALARFQEGIHEDYANGQPLSAETFDKRLGDELSELYGNAYEVQEYDRTAWAEINHLYWGFYVYKYPLGAAVGFHNAEQISKGNGDFLKRYFTFLSSGNSKSLEADMKALGIDLANGEYCEAIEKKYEALVNEYISLTK